MTTTTQQARARRKERIQRARDEARYQASQIADTAQRLLVAATAAGQSWDDLQTMAKGAFDAAEAFHAEAALREEAALKHAKLLAELPAFEGQPE